MVTLSRVRHALIETLRENTPPLFHCYTDELSLFAMDASASSHQADRVGAPCLTFEGQVWRPSVCKHCYKTQENHGSIGPRISKVERLKAEFLNKTGAKGGVSGLRSCHSRYLHVWYLFANFLCRNTRSGGLSLTHGSWPTTPKRMYVPTVTPMVTMSVGGKELCQRTVCILYGRVFFLTPYKHSSVAGEGAVGTHLAGQHTESRVGASKLRF